MKDLELANKLANIYCAQWWTDETKLEQLRILRSTVIAPLLGPIIDMLAAEVTSYDDIDVRVLAESVEMLRNFVIGEKK